MATRADTLWLPMAFTCWTRWTTTLLLGSCWWAPTAAANEPAEPISVSEPEDPAPVEVKVEVEDPLPMLVHLAESGDAQGLRTEALKAQHLDPDNPDLAYLVALGTWQVEDDVSALTAVAERYPEDQAGELATLMIAEHWLRAAPSLGVVKYQAYMRAHADGAWHQQAATQAAWGLAHDGYFNMALTQLDNEGVPVPDELRVTLSTSPEWKRPLVATALSGGLPGLGQLYAGQPLEAASAFMVNALFIGGMTYAARNEQWTALGVTAFFGLGFYMGNIYGAADASLRHNRGLRDDILLEMETTWPAETPLPTLP